MEQKKLFSKTTAVSVSALLLASNLSASVALAADAAKTEEKAAPISEVVNYSDCEYD